MSTLTAELRKKLERTVIQAREVAETAARAALQALAVPKHEPFGHMDSEQRRLRRRLRAHARQLGDRVDARSGEHGIAHLLQECAYQHWHGMLFARFLAENHLLIEPEAGIAITLDECEELAKEEGIDRWALAARFAQGMLPQVFRPDNPVFGVQFAREHRSRLEKLVEGLPVVVFTAADALGWVYQFWQTQKKNEVNRSEVKIGADELPAVTQLFTEPYMVQFMLHNSLGAWWAAQRLSADDLKMASSEQELRRKAALPGVALDYLRFVRNEDGVWSPAVGAFVVWPERLGKLRLLDPCCGSGHFLVAALLMLAPMRMALEELSATEAVDAVLRDNLHGLELDQRCVAIAAFALALEAWRYPDAGGFRTLPKLNLACCGQPVGGKREQWLALAGGDERLEAGMAALHDSFRDAPILGSLIDPARALPDDLYVADFAEALPLLEQALREHAGEEEWEETAIAAQGLTEAARLLSGRYHLVITNVPYLARGKHDKPLRKFVETHYARAKNDLANVFLERCLELSHADGGVTQIVMPQNWLFLGSYKAQRGHLLKEARWELLARLGPGAFETISGEVVKAILLTLANARPQAEDQLLGIDASTPRTVADKAVVLQEGEVLAVSQLGQLENPDARITQEAPSDAGTWLSNIAEYGKGSTTGDSPRFLLCFWEFPCIKRPLFFWLNSPTAGDYWSGRSQCMKVVLAASDLTTQFGCRIHGQPVWGRSGIAVNKMRRLEPLRYAGEVFDDNICPICPTDKRLIPAILAYVESDQYRKNVRSVDQALKVTAGTLTKVPFDLDRWIRVAKQRYPKGLPKPYSDDPTQWIFHGHPCGSVVWDEASKCTGHGPLRTDATVLQVAVARLLGYGWPAESDPKMELASEQREWVRKTRALYSLEDEDGIVCLPSVRRERPAHERLLQLLQAAWGKDWRDGHLSRMLAETGSPNLDDWLRNRFFEQHCKLFHQRPFLWHIWDGRKGDGFHALVNYHKLAEGGGKGRRLLESLTYSYLGDWVTRQQDGVNRGESGSEGRLAAALALQQRLIAILAGEPPCDLFIRWKPLREQPIGWQPDINDGVRLNIRPFLAQDIPSGNKGAGVLRTKPNIHWRKDRGKEPLREQGEFPWFWNNGAFTGDRLNDIHLSIEEKHAAHNTSVAATAGVRT